MATTTPNYGWTVPTSTDLVKDGATAIETLGDAIDASMNTALGTKKAGMVLLNTTSFNGVASQSLPNNTFTSTYNDYRLVITIDAVTSDQECYLKLRASGTDSSATYYYGLQGLNSINTLYSAAGANVTAGFWLMENDTGATAKPTMVVVELFTPALAQRTNARIANSTNATGGVYAGWAGFGSHTTATAYDSATLISSAGNITGSIVTYGFNK